MKKVTVIGAGNGGTTAAYHFAKDGHSVCLFDTEAFSENVAAAKENGGIEALAEYLEGEMILPGFEKIDLATTDIKEAMEFADIYVMVCPSFAQEKLFGMMIPYLKDGAVIIIMPGNYGGLVMKKALDESDKAGIDVTFVDAISIPWACRVAEPGKTAIMGIKEFLPVSIFPSSKKTEETVDIINDVLPIPAEILPNPIVAGLENINFGGHPLMATVNIGLLENFNGEFNYYRDCCSTATANAADKMDKERVSVGNALGFKLRTELEAMNALYASDEKSVYDFNRKSGTHGKIKNAPDSSKSRYITEDVPYLLVPCYHLAKACGLEVPVIQACITLAGAYNDEDYFSSGRTLEKMGIEENTVEGIKKFLDAN